MCHRTFGGVNKIVHTNGLKQYLTNRKYLTDIIVIIIHYIKISFYKNLDISLGLDLAS